MSNIRDYLNLGLHRGFDACESMGGYTSERFTANCANLCGNAVIDEKEMCISQNILQIQELLRVCSLNIMMLCRNSTLN